MKIAAITIIDFVDNEMKQMVFVVGDKATWKDAYIEALRKGIDGNMNDPDHIEWVTNDLSDDLSEARNDLTSAEMDVVVTFIDLVKN